MKNIKKYTGLLAGTLAITTIVHGGRSMFKPAPRSYYAVKKITRSPFGTRLPQEAKLADIEAFSLLQKRKSDLRQQEARFLLEEEGFTISETPKSNAYEAIMECLTRNCLPQKELVNLEYLYWGCLSSKRFFAEVSKILGQPIIYFAHGFIYFFNDGEINMLKPMHKNLLHILDACENGIIIFQGLGNAFYTVTPSNR